ncbi:alpha/beta fold hydrolase [Pacificispira sp.]|uniref:alpha/beta fold hydrolase n=1 Tax=Pacificispira sp. TaxID=2888761 RepID=UPI003BA95B30
MAHQFLFLHGWTMHGGIFDGLIARLGDRCICAAPDLPGHGSAKARPPTLDDCADVVASALDALGPDPVIPVGWSMGAAAVWRYIRRHGTGKVTGLVTVDMSPRVSPAKDWPHGLIGQTEESVAASTARFETDWHSATESIAATMFGSPEGAPRFSRSDALRIIRGHSPAAMRALWHDLVALDERALIPQIDVPYLVCSGQRSRVYPESASRWIADQAPQSRHAVFEMSGHSPHLEEPATFARTLLDFADQL